jgi:hypothetical protein
MIFVSTGAIFSLHVFIVDVGIPSIAVEVVFFKPLIIFSTSFSVVSFRMSSPPFSTAQYVLCYVDHGSVFYTQGFMVRHLIVQVFVVVDSIIADIINDKKKGWTSICFFSENMISTSPLVKLFQHINMSHILIVFNNNPQINPNFLNKHY